MASHSPRSFTPSVGKFKHTSNEVCALAKKASPKVLLAFSCGKDSIAAWLQLVDKGFDVLPAYQYYVPDLEFVEESLSYYEKFFSCKIIRVPHPLFYGMLETGAFQTHDRAKALEDAGVPTYTGHELRTYIKEDHGLEDSYTAFGMRAADSVARYLMFKAHGGIFPKKLNFYPVFDWKKDQVLDSFRRHKIKLPIDYKIFGRSFEGPRYLYLTAIRKHFPRDYKKILHWFPLAELELLRHGEKI